MAYTTIDNPFKFFNTVLYTGANKSITGVNFQPDWVWIKERDSGYHAIFDSIRGVTKVLSSNVNVAESTQSDTLTAFGTDGFTLGADSANYVGGSSTNTVSWNWLAGGSASSNSDGSITSSVSANTTAGFSIVSYTGTGSNATVGHGLGVAPKWILVKSRDASENWVVFHKSLNSSGAGTYIYLNTQAAAAGGGSNTSIFNNTAPTSSVFSIGTDGNINNSGDDYIAYCFAEIKGYSKVGSWKGRSNPFIYTGFSPSFILGKNATNASAYDWWIVDNKRDVNNDNSTNFLRPNGSDAEQTATSSPVSFLSNGFSLTSTEHTFNGDGQTMIFMAFAESPFVTAGTKAAGTAR